MIKNNNDSTMMINNNNNNNNTNMNHSIVFTTNIALLPIGLMAFVNHHFNSSLINVQVEWHDWSRVALINYTKNELMTSPFTRLNFQYRATRDIAVDEELFLNYGDEWERVWLEYSQQRRQWDSQKRTNRRRYQTTSLSPSSSSLNPSDTTTTTNNNNDIHRKSDMPNTNTYTNTIDQLLVESENVMTTTTTNNNNNDNNTHHHHHHHHHQPMFRQAIEFPSHLIPSSWWDTQQQYDDENDNDEVEINTVTAGHDEIINQTTQQLLLQQELEKQQLIERSLEVDIENGDSHHFGACAAKYVASNTNTDDAPSCG